MINSKYPNGSEWRKWDLHIHTPASFHWNGQRFNSDPRAPENASLVDEMINALNSAEPAVFAIMDYWTFDGWFALKHRLSQADAPKLEKTVFPGIELRLMSPLKGRLNAHVLFSDQIDDQELIDFKSNLKLEFAGEDVRNLSDQALIEYARFVPSEKLKHHSFDRGRVMEDREFALQAGSKMAELNCESYKQAITKVKNEQAIGFMPFDTSDGLAGIERNEHYAYVLGLFKTSPIFETRNLSLWEAFSGIKTTQNEAWIGDFQLALNNIPRLAVSGSDAHRFIGEQGNNDRRGYGDYPSGKATWIKANPTFQGLQQAIKEPAKRSFIGIIPPKIQLVKENRSIFIDKLEVIKEPESTFSEHWLDNTKLTLNHDLVAIIGNKGSGKSALADITALLGNSKQSHHFSFLKENRFRGKTGAPAKHFIAKAIWVDGQVLEKNLNENPATENVEYVKYIPQGHFEELCNAHVSGKSDSFEQELRSVIFSHADDATRLGAHNFDQLIEQQESSLRSYFDSLRSALHKLNRQISSIEGQMSDETRKSIEEKLNQKNRLIQEHTRIKPEEIPEPTSELSTEQQVASAELTQIALEIESIVSQQEANKAEMTQLALKKKACLNIQEGIDVVKRAITQFRTEYSPDAIILGMGVDTLISLETKDEQLIVNLQFIQTRNSEITANNQQLDVDIASRLDKRGPLNAKLNGPQQDYQQYLELLKVWVEKESEILGSKDLPDTFEGLKHRLEQLDELPVKRITLQAQRMSITEQIFDRLDEQRISRESLFNPVQQLIQNNALIRDEYKLQFKAEIKSTPELVYSKLFALVKQTTGEFRGDSESLAVLKDMMDRHDISNKLSLREFVQELHDKLETVSKLPGVESLLKKDRTTNEVYDFIFGLEYLDPRYTLMFQDAQIGQLSPGQRGALLLIFYLLVDKGNKPIILDQPEENLDNETIVSLLVPVLTEAKKKRQIIMVTHNPNLAVVCDAEQIIHCEFIQSDSHNINYISGAIECSVINNKVVDVLEGTMPAFDNRKIKYM
ncbi:TrlF family AAA-like ATPase [Colwellia sp. BRX8-6]|uniref:TrlF family AAA-like ATPase n=1 Tax=Colwellia sp. BRX8-6 TaxID=2759834 RepID=UPI0015F5710B|nr:ABC transporter [Colwellia sp. BRX8-6]MBA6359773.1 ABC transporter [Colwellia sp. BRX8-6]